MRGFQRGDRKRLTGWRRAAHINSFVLVVTSSILVGCLLASTIQGPGFSKAWMFYAGTHNGATTLNLTLHLLLNALSTALLASSNFFVQVLVSPSRVDLDLAHSRGQWLGIGVFFVKNLVRLGRFRMFCWIFLMASSIPMHLVFNSIVFQTNYFGSEYHLTIASEGLVSGAPYYPPGASLIPAGFSGYVNNSWSMMKHYGDQQSITKYLDTTSEPYKNITAAATYGRTWNNISAVECYDEYVACEGLSTHGDVIVVVNHSTGWMRDDIWNLTSAQAEFWNGLVPAKEANSLWYSTQCAMVAVDSTDYGTVVCNSGCQLALGDLTHVILSNGKPTSGSPFASTNASWTIDFFNSTGKISSILPETASSLIPAAYAANLVNPSKSLLQKAVKLTVAYCLTQPISPVYSVGVSNTLLLTVTICALVKTITAILVTVVLSRQSHAPLVTLGDAMASFIQRPDPNTTDMSAIDQGQIHLASIASYNAIRSGPRQWKVTQKRRRSYTTSSFWLGFYVVFPVIVLQVVMFATQGVSSRGIFGEYAQSDENSFLPGKFTFVGGVLAANSPQLLLSIAYLAYNNIITKLQIAKEWSQFSLGYHPLRVTDPKGQQYSTYRLQLPYKYSIPLIAISVALHWLLSNTLYLYIAEGGYYGTSSDSRAADDSLPPGAVVSLGYSVWAGFIFLFVILVLIPIPLMLSLKKLPLHGINMGCNSLVISAACHVSPISKAAPVTTSTGQFVALEARPSSTVASAATTVHSVNLAEEDGIEMQNLLNRDSATYTERRELSKQEIFELVSINKVRWGVVPMPEEWYQACNLHYREREGRVEHLSFGVEDDRVQVPVLGNWYM